MVDKANARRAKFPTDYGSRGSEQDVPLEWSEVEGWIRDAPNYWLTSVTAAGKPHARPVDGVWVDGALCFGGSPATRWVRNLQENPAVSVHLPTDDEVVILEGTAEYVSDPDHPLAGASTAANKEKYPQYFGDGQRVFHPFWSLRPSVVYAWSLTGFPNRATRWQIER